MTSDLSFLYEKNRIKLKALIQEAEVLDLPRVVNFLTKSETLFVETAVKIEQEKDREKTPQPFVYTMF